MGKPKWDRKFYGKIIVGQTDRKMTDEERQLAKYENAHLKAYMKGASHFRWGTETIKHHLTGADVEVPHYEEVKFELIKL